MHPVSVFVLALARGFARFRLDSREGGQGRVPRGMSGVVRRSLLASLVYPGSVSGPAVAKEDSMKRWNWVLILGAFAYAVVACGGDSGGATR